MARTMINRLLAGTGIMMLAHQPIAAQQILFYTENTNSATEIALGYPVPMPVDSLTAVDGFRSYDSLIAHHMDLALSNDEVTEVQVGMSHKGRPIYAYVFSDMDDVDNEGRPESAILINGTIHAREWGSPEVVTELMEQLIEKKNDNAIVQYILDNGKVVILPISNPDGNLQTQQNSDQTTPTPPGTPITTDPPQFDSPRDGRMRRKNLLDTDEDLNTDADRLLGVDLNRNNSWFFNGPSGNSPDPESIVYRGPAPASEPEIQALQAASALAPINRLRLYIDTHTFSRVYFVPQTGNTRRDSIATRLANIASASTTTFGQPAYFPVISQTPGQDISTTATFFAFEYQIPSWTLEIEPPAGFPGLPSGGAYYGGNGVSHDGFILPDSEVARARDENALSYIVTIFHMLGPPHLRELKFYDNSANEVFSSKWELQANGQRAMIIAQSTALRPGQTYTGWINFNKPMRYEGDSGAAEYPGQSAFANTTVSPTLAGTDANGSPFSITPAFVTNNWKGQVQGAPSGYGMYVNDAIQMSFTIPSTVATTAAGVNATFSVSLSDLASQVIDSNPATPVDWSNGHWTGLENSSGQQRDIGGTDSNFTVQVVSQTPITTGGGTTSGGGGGGTSNPL